MRVRSAVVVAAGSLALLALLGIDSARSGGPAPPSSPGPSSRHAESPGPPAAGTIGADDGLPMPSPERQPMTPVAAPTADCDPDWSAIPRDEVDQVLRFVRHPAGATELQVLRSATFNPRDRWLPPATREQIVGIQTRAAAAAERLTLELEAVAELEVQAAQWNGLARSIDLRELAGDVPLAGLGPRPVLRDVGGTTLAIPRSAMARTVSLEDTVRDLGAGLVTDLARAFASAGALTADEVDALTSRTARTRGRP